jgi:hypothetical protein
MPGLGLLNVLYCVMLPLGLICALYFLSIFSELFQIIMVNISVGMLLAQVRGVGSATPIQRDSMDEVDFAVIRLEMGKQGRTIQVMLTGRCRYASR